MAQTHTDRHIRTHYTLSRSRCAIDEPKLHVDFSFLSFKSIACRTLYDCTTTV